MAAHVTLNPFIVKLAARCNLNCSYCYVYNQADHRWKNRPALMTDCVYEAAIERIRRHCLLSRQTSIMLLFHGGEPMLVGAPRFEQICRRARHSLQDLAAVALAIQTNGTLIDAAWIRVFKEQSVQVGVSMDGPQDVHDVFRIDHLGRGSYDSVAGGLHLLRKAEIPFTILSVVQPGADPLRIHRHFLSLGCRSVSYLLPAYNHDTIGPIWKEFGPTPCADFLIPIFDDWWFNGTMEVQIREFWSMGRLILGGESDLDSVGNPPLRFVSIETDGSMEGLDKLRICEDGMTNTGLNVRSADFCDIAEASSFHASVMNGLPLPEACKNCPERHTCAGGYVPHRYSKERQFDNPSVWCADLLKLFKHIRERLGVSVEETLARRQALQQSSQSHRQEENARALANAPH
jgi:uncharacterized protein